MSETAVKERRASVSSESFLRGYFAGNKAGQTNKEIAESLNMSVATFNVRLSQARKRTAEAVTAGKLTVNPFDGIKTNRKSGSGFLATMNSVVAGLDAVDAETPVVNEVAASVVTPEGETVSA